MMNVPAIAKRTFEELKSNPEYNSIVQIILEELTTQSTAVERAILLHHKVDEYNNDVFSHPLVKEFSPCKAGCSGCCHTQVSVTDDEAELLGLKVEAGLEIDLARLALQMSAGDDSNAYYKLSYEDRKCVFLDDAGSCRVYQDRPSVCRTNAVLGDAEQCDTRVAIKPQRLIKTAKSDMAVYASFLFSKVSGTLPHMLGKFLTKT